MIKRKALSKAEELFALQCRALKLPVPQREHMFAAHEFGRLWRFDFSWAAHMVAVEIEGLTVNFRHGKPVVGGRHVSVKGFAEDAIKYAHAAMLGWFVVRWPQNLVKSGLAVELTRQLLVRRGWKRDAL